MVSYPTANRFKYFASVNDQEDSKRLLHFESSDDGKPLHPLNDDHYEFNLANLSADNEKKIGGHPFSEPVNFKHSDDQVSLTAEDEFYSIVNKLIELDLIDGQQKQNNPIVYRRNENKSGHLEFRALNNQDRQRLKVSISFNYNSLITLSFCKNSIF